MSISRPISTHVQSNVGNKLDNLPMLLTISSPKAASGGMTTATCTRNAVFVATCMNTCTQNNGFLPMITKIDFSNTRRSADCHAQSKLPKAQVFVCR